MEAMASHYRLMALLEKSNENDDLNQPDQQV